MLEVLTSYGIHNDLPNTVTSRGAQAGGLALRILHLACAGDAERGSLSSFHCFGSEEAGPWQLTTNKSPRHSNPPPAGHHVGTSALPSLPLGHHPSCLASERRPLRGNSYGVRILEITCACVPCRPANPAKPSFPADGAQNHEFAAR